MKPSKERTRDYLEEVAVEYARGLGSGSKTAPTPRMSRMESKWYYLSKDTFNQQVISCEKNLAHIIFGYSYLIILFFIHRYNSFPNEMGYNSKNSMESDASQNRETISSIPSSC